jgi:nitroimidazol reductase NimA-like FMN-containing flavoprotein (pyridoxamine 5'-phosphate oxidase superfamily)
VRGMLHALRWFGGKAMRHPEREMKNKETITALLEQSQVGRMATVNREGFPVIKPVNFLYWDGKIYIHSSLKGEKIKDIRRRSLVCFEVDESIAYVAGIGTGCKANYYYRSIIIKGKAAFVKHEGKKMKILEKLMEKYQPEGGYEGISGEILKKTAVIEITAEAVTAKGKLG